MSRRAALRALAAVLAGLAVATVPSDARTPEACDSHGTRPRARGERHRARVARVVHPEPRPGITAAAVLPADRVPKRARAVYDQAREIPGVLDGIYCHCDCAERDGLRSLLSCFETEMVASCRICSGQAKLAYELHRRGKTLDEIRASVDAKFGD